MKDYYYLLGLKHTATLDEIKDSYRRLAKKFHPDLNDGDSFFAERFKDINEAYDILSDSNKKSKYDATLNFPRNNESSSNQNNKSSKTTSQTIELKQESIDFLANNHPRCFEFKLTNNFGNNIAAEYIIQPDKGKIVVNISFEYSNDKTIVKICGITALLGVTNEAMSSRIIETYKSAYNSRFNKSDSDWRSDIDLIDNHIEGLVLNDLCNFVIIDGKISPRTDSFSEISLWSKAFKTAMKGFFVSSFDRNEVPKWLYYLFTGCKSEYNFAQKLSSKRIFFGGCNRIQIKSDLN
jgi:curved DNA-binding protein CbpA